MNKTLTIIAMLLMGLTAQAQNTPLAKYQQVPDIFYHTFIDHVRLFPSYRVETGNGAYIGQADEDDMLYGFGSYSDESGQKVGMFRAGAYEFGIQLTGTYALIGTSTDYVAYSLATARIEYIVRAGETIPVTQQESLDYAFVGMDYNNGDRYIGEIYQNRRHGFGLYFYAQGGFWFGQYDNGKCHGPGCLFRPDDTMRVGWYENGFEIRACEVLPRNKR